MKLLHSTFVFSAFTLVSRLAGFIRDSLQASLFGAGPAMSAFVVAYRIPNYLRRVFAEGSFASAFVPVLSDLKQKGDEAALRDFLDHVTGALLAAVILITGIGILCAPWLARLFLIFAGKDSAQVALVADMLRITFPYLVFISMAALAGSALNSFRHFGLPAFAPVLHNIAVIVAMLVFARYFNIPEKALAWGVCAAGMLQMLLLWPALAKLGLYPRLRLSFQHQGVRRVFRLMLPTIFSSSVAQLNLLVGTMFAGLLVVESQSWLYYSDRLVEFPLGLFGVAIGTVILPHLSRRHADTDHVGFSSALDWGLRLTFLIGLPAALGLALLAEPLTATLFGHGKFRAVDVQMTAYAIVAMSLGIPAFMLSKILLPAFYSRQDSKTPMRVAIQTVLVNIVLTIILVTPLWWFKIPGAHVGIATATALAGIFNAWLLWLHLRRIDVFHAAPGWRLFFGRIAVAVSLMTFLLWVMRLQMGDWMAFAPFQRAALLLLAILLGAAAYALTLWLTGMRPADMREPKSG